MNKKRQSHSCIVFSSPQFRHSHHYNHQHQQTVQFHAKWDDGQTLAKCGMHFDKTPDTYIIRTASLHISRWCICRLSASRADNWQEKVKMLSSPSNKNHISIPTNGHLEPTKSTIKCIRNMPAIKRAFKCGVAPMRINKHPYKYRIITPLPFIKFNSATDAYIYTY